MALTVNNVKYDGGSVEINVDGSEFQGADSISYGFSNEKVKVKGIGRQALNQTVGFFSVDDGSMELHADQYHGWLNSVGTPKAFTEKEFEIVVKYIDENESPIIVTIKKCRVVSVAASDTFSDAGNLVRTVNFSALDIETE